MNQYYANPYHDFKHPTRKKLSLYIYSAGAGTERALAASPDNPFFGIIGALESVTID